MEIDTDMELVDEVLAEDFWLSDEYDRWRDAECAALELDLKDLVDKHLHPKKHGYYKDMPEKFLEHAVAQLKYLTKCDLIAFENSMVATKKDEIKVEVVNDFKEGEHETIRAEPRTILGN